RTRRDTVPRRLAFADRCPQLYSILSLVFPEVERATLRLHLGARYASAHSRRSNHELRLEIHASDGVQLYRRCRRLALPGPRSGRLALVAGSDRNRLSHAFAPP